MNLSASSAIPVIPAPCLHAASFATKPAHDQPAASAQPRPDSQLDRPLDTQLAQFISSADLHRSHFLRLARRFTDRPEDAEDIVQQAMYRAFRKLSTFRGDAQMKTWLSVIVVNAAREFARNQRTRLLVPLEVTLADGDSEEFEIPDTRVNPEEDFQHVETGRILAATVGGLEPPKRQIVEMCLLDELPYTQIAATLNVTVSTVKSRMFRCRRDLRSALALRYGEFR